VNSIYVEIGSINAVSQLLTRKVHNIHLQSAEQVWESLLENVGAFKPVVDPVDLQLFSDLRNGTGNIIDCVDRESLSNSLLNKSECKYESAYGRWPVYTYKRLVTDKDADGIDDNWEIKHGLSPDIFGDHMFDKFGYGYSNLEYYLNELAGDYEQGIVADQRP